MKQLLNTLFVTSEDIYLSLEGENVLANRDKTVVARYPLHTLQAIVSFSYAGASPARRPGSVWPSAPRTDVSLPAPAARAAATYCSVVSSTVSLTTPLAAVR
jgi:CRISPR-associated protein Cas1